MGKITDFETKTRCVTKGVMEKVDNFTQHFIWTKIVDKLKVKADELYELELIKCEICNCQAVRVKDTDGSFNECWFAPEITNAELIVFYDADKNTEYLMLKSEAENLTKE